jgi:hypothetical protein
MFFTLILSSCKDDGNKEQVIQKGINTEVEKMSEDQIKSIVEQIPRIEGMPPKRGEPQTNEIAATIIKLGNRASPYLVEKITDENQSQNPKWYVNGDIAHVLLCEIYNRDWPNDDFAVENKLISLDNRPYLNYYNSFLRSDDIEQNRKNRR